MAIGDAYATATEYRTAVIRTDTSDDAVIDLDLKSVSRFIERRVGRFFTVDANDVTRIYLPGRDFGEPLGGHKHLWIHDLSAAPTSITIDEDNDGSYADETALTTSEFEMWPLDALVGPEARPYTRIDMTAWGDQGAFPHRHHVQVIGKWGWAAVPDAIKQATIHITAMLRLESPRATRRIDSELGGGDRMSTSEISPGAQRILWDLIEAYGRPVGV